MYFTEWTDIPTHAYGAIYVDPPWSYRDKRDGNDQNHGSASNVYPTMSAEDIKRLPVATLAAPDCMLFMWATFPNLPQGLETMAAWGFIYKTLGFSWIKLYPKALTPRFGIGHYTKSNCEVCLIGVRGRPPIASNAVSSVILSPLRKHSQKPDEARERIMQLTGDVKRIELFARGEHAGFDTWGNTPEGIPE